MALYTFSIEGRLKTWCYTLPLPSDWRLSMGFKLPTSRRGFRPIFELWRARSLTS